MSVSATNWPSDLIPQSSSKAQKYSNARPSRPGRQPKLVPMEVEIGADTFVNSAQRAKDRNASFGQRRQGGRSSLGGKGKERRREVFEDGGAEISWTPSESKYSESSEGGRRDRDGGKKKGQSMPFSLEKGGSQSERPAISESERKGRTQRRTGIRSGSKNAFRRK
jgi:ribosome biogenesis protein ENP2